MKTLHTLFVLVLACSLVGACAATPADEVAAGAVSAYSQVSDYTAAVAVSGPDADEVLRVAAMPPGRFRADYGDPSLHRGVALAVLSDEKVWWYLSPQAGGTSTWNGKPVDGDYMAAGIAALSHGLVTGMHQDVLDGKSVTVVDIVPVGTADPFPRDTERLSVWIDGDTMLPLRIEGYDRNGTLLRSAEYHDLRVNVGLAGDTFAFRKPRGVWERIPAVTPDFFMNLAYLLVHLVILPLGSFLALHVMLNLGYRRVTQKNILENATRRQVYQVVSENPGIRRREIARITEINPGTLRYHLAVLRAGGKIAVEQTGGCCRYYENNGKFSGRERTVIASLRNTARREILTTLLRTPGLSRQEIAGRLGISGPAVSRHMGRLLRAGIVEKNMNGRTASFVIAGESEHSVLNALHREDGGKD